jgi:pyruvate carboxylase
LGWPDGGWPEPLWRAVLGEKRFKEAKAKYLAAAKAAAKPRAKSPESRAGVRLSAHGSQLLALRAELSEKLKREATDDELYSHLMYPAVFADFVKHQREFGDVSVLPTPAFFYGLKPGEEISVEIEEGKVLIIRLVSIGAPDKDGRRTLSYELNGIAREAFIADKSVAPKTKARVKVDPADPLQIAAPIPGLIVVLSTSVGAKVAKGDKLFMMEAMKMQTTVYAQADGVVAEVNAATGDTVEAKDLIVRLRPAS